MSRYLGSVYDGFTLCVEHFTVPRTLREAIFMHGVLYQAAAAKWWHVINGGTHDVPRNGWFIIIMFFFFNG